MSTKTLDQYFRDWEASAFGYGYGNGEEHILPVLQKFLALCVNGENKHAYDHNVLEKELGGAVTWFLINVLCHKDIIDYGSSPRYGWLTTEGERLRDYINTKTLQQLYDIVCDSEGGDITTCYEDSCNCGPNGYQKGVLCLNPFWKDRVKKSLPSKENRNG